MPGLFDGTPLERPVTCQRCEKPLADCRCPRDATGQIRLPKDQPVRVRRETGGRGGKTVTVIAGLDPAATDMTALLKELKAALGTGGAVKEAAASTSQAGSRGNSGRGAPASVPTIELQGDHRERVVDLLNAKGYPAKGAGG